MRKKDFTCKRCGSCCRHYVLVTGTDIQRIEKAGYRDFMTNSRFDKRKKCLRMIARDCIFLGYNADETFCRIYESRPEICRTYPFFSKNIEDCKPRSILGK